MLLFFLAILQVFSPSEVVKWRLYLFVSYSSSGIVAQYLTNAADNDCLCCSLNFLENFSDSHIIWNAVYPLPSIGRTRKSGYVGQGYIYPYLPTYYVSISVKNATESPQIPANGKLYRTKSLKAS